MECNFKVGDIVQPRTDIYVPYPNTFWKGFTGKVIKVDCGYITIFNRIFGKISKHRSPKFEKKNRGWSRKGKMNPSLTVIVDSYYFEKVKEV